jgi:anti-anti-sigma factor
LIFDFAAVDYISSAGLRVVMIANQNMEECDGSLTVCNVNEDVMEVFEYK